MKIHFGITDLILCHTFTLFYHTRHNFPKKPELNNGLDVSRTCSILLPGLNTALINRIAIPDLDYRDNYFSLYWITVFLSASRSSNNLQKLNTYGKYFELFKQSWGITRTCFDVNLDFEERILLYFAVNLLVICKYIVKTAKIIVYQTIRYESLSCFSCPKYFYI